MIKTNDNCKMNNKCPSNTIDFLNQLLEQEISNLETMNQKISNCEIKLDIKKEYMQSVNTIRDSQDINHSIFSPSMSQDSKLIDADKERVCIEITNEEKDIKDYIEARNQIQEKVEQLTLLANYVHNQSNRSVKDQQGLEMLEMQEFERKRIARDLHDSTVQNLTMMVHKTELCLKLSEVDIVRMKLELQTLIGSIKNTIDDMRDIIYDLRPMSIDDLGLIVTVERFIRGIIKNSNTNVVLEVNVKEINLLPVINLTLFRIIQEACNNALKHARAKNICINIAVDNNCLKLVITDDGIGIDKEKLDKAESGDTYGFGLSIMKERVYLLSGEMEIETAGNKGTSLFVRVPL